MNSREEKRLERMGIIKRSIEKAGDRLNMEKLIAMCLCEFGCARRTAMEYIKAVKLHYGL
jgi:hypothetical protein